jgi:hypothetical protein
MVVSRNISMTSSNFRSTMAKAGLPTARDKEHLNSGELHEGTLTAEEVRVAILK